MYSRQIYQIFSDNELKDVSKYLHKYFPLVKPTRIYDLILQVDSLDKTLDLLVIHKNTEYTLDFLIYNVLEAKFNKEI